MIDALKRWGRRAGAAALIAALPLTALTMSEAAAQAPAAPAGVPGMPAMGDAYPLTPDLVAAWVESYPAVYEASQQLADQYDVPAGDTPAAGLAAYATVAGALAQLNDIVGQYGFSDYGEWVNVMLSVITAYAIVSQDIPANAAAMMLATFGQTQDNLDAVTANLDAVANVVGNLE
jgi:hypothetical protein